jgi:hypothetical protein
MVWGRSALPRIFLFGNVFCLRLGGVGWSIGFFGDRGTVEIMIFESKVDGAVESDFNEDGVFRANPDGLVLGELEELVFKTEREIISDHARGSEGKDLREDV